MKKAGLSLVATMVLAVAMGAAPTLAADSSTLKVKLKEYKIKGVPEELEAGSYKLVVTNRGVEPHEIIVVKGDDPEALPLEEPGVVDESKLDESDIVGQTGDIKHKKKESLTLELEPGSYIFFCNVLHDHGDDMGGMKMGDVGTHEHDDTTSAGHFGEGMYVVVTVT